MTLLPEASGSKPPRRALKPPSRAQTEAQGAVCLSNCTLTTATLFLALWSLEGDPQHPWETEAQASSETQGGQVMHCG